jgi:hypothetical protein
MSANKNIDEMLDNLDILLDMKKEDTAINTEEVTKQYHEKKLREQKGNSYQIVGLLFLCISLYFTSSALINQINSVTFGILAILSYWLNHKAKKEIAEQDLAVSFNDFRAQRKKIALALLKQFEGMRIVFSIALTITFGAYLYDYIKEPHFLKLIVYTISLFGGSFLAINSLQSGIKEYRELTKAQD